MTSPRPGVPDDLRFVPPRPRSLSPVVALLRQAFEGEGDLLGLLPAEAYRVPVGRLGYTRRQAVIVNDPALVRTVLHDADGIFPKNDLMVGAVAPLVGDSMFVSSGERWRRQRAMVEPGFTHMRIGAAFDAMSAAVDTMEGRLDAAASQGEVLSLDLLMSQLTADVICRTIFSTPLAGAAAREVFEAFDVFERGIGHVDLRRLILGRAFAPVPHDPAVLDACRTIRGHIDDFLAPRLAGEVRHDDICGAMIDARDAQTGAPFTREELIDQLGVFFLAGHETTASVLTWLFLLVTQQGPLRAALRGELDAVLGEGPVTHEATRRLPLARAVFRETARLYPPITFLPRVATAATRLGGMRVRRGAMVMVCPWTVHRHEALWEAPDTFDAARFLDGADRDLAPGQYIPFGHGPRVCVGAGFAQVESLLILARLLRRYDLERADATPVRPVARLTTRPREEIRIRVSRRDG